MQVIVSQATTVMWTAVAVATLLSAAIVVVALISLPNTVAILAAAAGLIIVTVVITAVRTTKKIRQVVSVAAAPAPAPAEPPAPPEPPASSESVFHLPTIVNRSHPPREFGARSGYHADMFATLSRRLQTLNARMINEIEDLERQIEDPALLKVVFKIDHLATRARRQSENLAVLGGSLMQNRNSPPSSITSVLRAAVAETEHYPQIMLVSTVDAYLRGHAVAEVIHLLAELMENATTFTNPHAPKVIVQASLVSAGVAIDIQDRGLGIQHERLQRLNAVLDGSLDIDLGDVISDGRIGLAVVKLLSSHHDVKVRLQHNMHGGIDANVVVPNDLLVMPEGQSERRTPRPHPRPLQADPATSQLQPPAPRLPATMSTGGRRRAEPTAIPSAPAWDLEPAREPLPPGELPRRRVQPRAPLPDPAGVSGSLDVDGYTEDLPPLPQRTGTHLHPELLAPPTPTAPSGGHNPRLLADIQGGRLRGEADQEPVEAAPSYNYPIFDEGQHRYEQ